MGRGGWGGRDCRSSIPLPGGAIVVRPLAWDRRPVELGCVEGLAYLTPQPQEVVLGRAFRGTVVAEDDGTHVLEFFWHRLLLDEVGQIRE